MKYRNYQTDPERIEYTEMWEKARRSRNRWLAVQIIGVILLITLQVVLILTDLVPNEYMLFFPLVVVVWGGFFVARSWWHGRKMMKYLNFYYTKDDDES